MSSASAEMAGAPPPGAGPLAREDRRSRTVTGAFPRFARNPGSGEPIATATRLLAADQSVFHDAARPSAIILPVAQA